MEWICCKPSMHAVKPISPGIAGSVLLHLHSFSLSTDAAVKKQRQNVFSTPYNILCVIYLLAYLAGAC